MTGPENVDYHEIKYNKAPVEWSLMEKIDVGQKKEGNVDITAIDISGDNVMAIYQGEEGKSRVARFKKNNKTSEWTYYTTSNFESDRVVILKDCSVSGKSSMVISTGNVWFEDIRNSTPLKLPKQSGKSCSMDGNYSVVGMGNDSVADDSAHFSGIGFYSRFCGMWKEVSEYTPEDSNEANLGYSVSISGNYAIVGAPGHERLNTGRVVFFEMKTPTTGWELVHEIHGTTKGSYFGASVGISGNYAVVGAPGVLTTSGNSTIDSVVYFYERSNQTHRWEQVYSIMVSDPQNSQFGLGVSIDGNYIMIIDPKTNNTIFLQILGGKYNYSVQKVFEEKKEKKDNDTLRYFIKVKVSGNYCIRNDKDSRGKSYVQIIQRGYFK